MPATERDDSNLNSTRNVAEAAIANKTKRFVYSSSDVAYDSDRVVQKRILRRTIV